MKNNAGLLSLLLSFIVLFSGSALAATLFSDQFSDQNPLRAGWTGDYFNQPYSNGRESATITSDLFTKLKSINAENYIVEINNYAAMIKTFDTRGYDNITLRYCRSTTTLVETTAQLKTGWRLGEHNSSVIEIWNGDENWSEWSQLEAVDMGHHWDCKEFALSGASDQERVSIAFFFDGQRAMRNGTNYQAGFIEEVTISGDAIPSPGPGGGGGGGTGNSGGGGGSDGGSKGAGTTTLTPPSPPQACVEDWICQEWVACENGKQTRACGDRNNCGTFENRPELEQTCVAAATETLQPAPGIFSRITGAVIGPNGAPTALGFLILLVLILALYLLMKMFGRGKAVGGKKARMGKRARMGKKGRR